MTDIEIREAIKAGEIELDPLDEASLQPASYDLRVGNKAIITRRVDVDKLRDRIKDDEPVPEIDVSKTGSITIPAGSFALVVTRERVNLSSHFAGHLGLRSYFGRKGLLLLAGLQVDPGFNGYLVLGLANVSPRSIVLSYEDPIATLELLRLSRAASAAYSGSYAGKQLKAEIPRPDADYLRTIETLSVSDLTEALLGLSANVSTLSRDVRILWVPLVIALVVAIILRVV